MKLVSFFRLGEATFGAEIKGGIIDLGARFRNEMRSKTIVELLETNSVPSQEELESFSPDYSFSDVTFLPVIPNPKKIICIGLNYEKHRLETKREQSGYPTIFTRFSDSQVAHNQYLVKPNESDRFDFEGELAIIIGKGGRNIREKDAFNHIAGYSCYNDGSIRDWQRHTSQFPPGKNFPKTGAFGPSLVLKQSIPDYRQLKIQTRLNGEIVQDAGLDQLIFDIPRLVSYCSTFTCLSIGDVIVTGTPGGVGDRRDPPLYLKEGDRVEVEISKVGLLKNQVINESSL